MIDNWPHIEDLEDFDRYKNCVQNGMRGLRAFSNGISPECDECNPLDEDCHDYDPYFSSYPCDLCNRNLGGNRHPSHVILEDSGEVIHLDICSDCMYYMEYGTLDDLTMLEIDPK